MCRKAAAVIKSRFATPPLICEQKYFTFPLTPDFVNLEHGVASTTPTEGQERHELFSHLMALFENSTGPLVGSDLNSLKAELRKDPDLMAMGSNVEETNPTEVSNLLAELLLANGSEADDANDDSEGVVLLETQLRIRLLYSLVYDFVTWFKHTLQHVMLWDWVKHQAMKPFRSLEWYLDNIAGRHEVQRALDKMVGRQMYLEFTATNRISNRVFNQFESAVRAASELDGVVCFDRRVMYGAEDFEDLMRVLRSIGDLALREGMKFAQETMEIAVTALQVGLFVFSENGVVRGSVVA
ncbi:unnamed protein product [Phytophthora lilii]|uniref:Unnamed protein product n=1 Tax=Phytophthora lilii TaxID=2077276 RepID=A0A9W6TJB5_9STRA|nr:unnamed protein product [Phytophthora lilii]